MSGRAVLGRALAACVDPFGLGQLFSAIPSFCSRLALSCSFGRRGDAKIPAVSGFGLLPSPCSTQVALMKYSSLLKVFVVPLHASYCPVYCFSFELPCIKLISTRREERDQKLAEPKFLTLLKTHSLFPPKHSRVGITIPVKGTNLTHAVQMAKSPNGTLPFLPPVLSLPPPSKEKG